MPADNDRRYLFEDNQQVNMNDDELFLWYGWPMKGV